MTHWIYFFAGYVSGALTLGLTLAVLWYRADVMGRRKR